MECEISIPSSFSLNANYEENNNRLMFGDSGFGYISIGRINKEVDSNLKVVKQEDYGHLIVINYEYSPTFKIDVIRSFDHEITLSGDSTKLTNELVKQCLESTDEVLVQVKKRELKGCVSRVNITQQLASLRETSRFAHAKSYSQDDEISKVIGWKIRILSNEGPMAKLGVKSSDLITHVCGIPMDQVSISHTDLCCQEESTKAIRLTIKPNGNVTRDILFPVQSPTAKPK